LKYDLSANILHNHEPDSEKGWPQKKKGETCGCHLCECVRLCVCVSSDTIPLATCVCLSVCTCTCQPQTLHSLEGCPFLLSTFSSQSPNPFFTASTEEQKPQTPFAESVPRRTVVYFVENMTSK